MREFTREVRNTGTKMELPPLVEKRIRCRLSAAMVNVPGLTGTLQWPLRNDARGYRNP
jgi:hypothetical protein